MRKLSDGRLINLANMVYLWRETGRKPIGRRRWKGRCGLGPRLQNASWGLLGFLQDYSMRSDHKTASSLHEYQENRSHQKASQMGHLGCIDCNLSLYLGILESCFEPIGTDCFCDIECGSLLDVRMLCGFGCWFGLVPREYPERLKVVAADSESIAPHAIGTTSGSSATTTSGSVRTMNRYRF